MANTDRTRKLLVRTALVTSTTITTLIGAQNFAMLDARDFQLMETPTSETMVIESDPIITNHAPEITVLKAAPSITIFRQSGQVNTASPAVAANTTQPATSIIQPPAPSQVSVPQPVVIQQPVAPRARSSR